MSHDELPVDAASIDYSEFADQFRTAPVNETNVKVEDDNYEVVVDRVYTSRSKSSNSPMIKWELTIVSGQRTGTKFAHRKLFRNNMLTSSQNMTWLKTDFLRCGFRVEEATQIPATLEKLKGLRLRVTQKTNGDNVNTYINGVAPANGPAQAAPAKDKAVVDSALGDFAPAPTGKSGESTSDSDLPF